MLHNNDIIKPNFTTHETNVLAKFHEDWAKQVSFRLFTCFHYIHIEKTAPPLGGHVFPPIMTIFELVRDIYNESADGAGSIVARYREVAAEVNANNVTSRANDPPPSGGHVFLPIRTIFELNRHIQKTHTTQETNVLTKFHEDWAKYVSYRLFTCFHYIHIEKTAPPPGGHVSSPIWTIFELIRAKNETNVLTKFHDDWAIMVTSRVFTRNTVPPPGGHTNIFKKLHEDWASNVTSTVFTIFELSGDINRTNVLTKFYEDQTINVASGVFTRQNVDDGRRTKGDNKSSP
ncbi:hypothetical protein DPMN_171233 [Dreissena polymorpha]|uniref:Uncharacterized protein n=1 Tax=Dreissena polymorpha TaxID=45954 RepID=A0A9D4IDZ4_DREPO|nr:hypothetical protein DPMN_171233 [Dreissena polymorpha]